MENLQKEFKGIVNDFMDKLKDFNKKYNLDKGNIYVEIDPSLDNINGMKDGKGNRIPNIGFLSEIKFILAENS